MKTIEIKTDSRISKILVGERFLNLGNYLPDTKIVIITDANVLKYYGGLFSDYPFIQIGIGETNKTLKTLEYIFNKFIELEVDRSSFIVGIGGGIVCDVVGFASSIFMRGLRFGFVSTTLLSQVDASVGGKNGVNFQRFKNMVGVFNQPDFVICDPEVLNTLEKKEFIAGFAEIVKVGAIRNSQLFEYLEKNWKKALVNDAEVINQLVYDSVVMKSKVVEKDEKEKGERKVLNFGHTFAHAFEKLIDVLHGEAVSMGMVLAAKLSEKLGFLAANEAKRITSLLRNLGLPVKSELDIDEVYKAMKQDKKREGDSINLILLKSIGNAFIYKTTYKRLEDLIHGLRSDI